MGIYETYISKSRYARYLDTEKRRENWKETVDRYMTFMSNHLKTKHNYDIPEDVSKELYFALENFEVVPSMRAIMTSGKALARDSTAGYNCSFLPVDDMKSFDEAMYILMCGTGVGFSVERQYVNKLPEIPERIYDSATTIVVSDSKEGWAKALRQVIAMLYSGEAAKWDVSKVRPAGTRLKIFGGRSSGPEPLVQLFEFITRTFKGAVGRKLNSLECHDIMCKVGEVVVVGGVRRSALISLSNLSDDRMRHAKSGAWWETQVQRALANNSACYTERPDVGTFMREWLSLYESKSGERGIFNREAAKNVVERNGRRDPNFEFGTNPCCFTGETLIAVADSRYDNNVVKISELASDSDGVISFSVFSSALSKSGKKPWKMEIKNAVAKCTGSKPIVKVTLSNGDIFKSTDDHPLATTEGTYVQVKHSVGIPLETLSGKDIAYVASVEQLGEEKIYDLQVEDNHNFYVITNTEEFRGILVHNSEIILRPYQFCVSGDTRLITRDGLVLIKDVVGKSIDIWNGEKWSTTVPFQTGTADQLHRVHISDGSYLDVTNNHKFLVKNRFETVYREVETIELIELLKTEEHSLHVPPANIKYTDGIFKEDAYDLGFILGDGFVSPKGKYPSAGLFGKDKMLSFLTGTISEKTYLNYRGTEFKVVKFNVDADFCRKLKYDDGLPSEIFGWDRASILNFIAGWADADGTQASKGIRIAGNGDKLRDAQLLLTKVGIKCSINFGAAAGTMTNLGERKSDLWYIQITKTDEIPCQRLKCDNSVGALWKGKNQIIKSIESISGLHPSYCLNESKLHQCVFNNILTKQCNLSEIIVRSNDTLKTLKKKARLATILGTYQSTLTHFPYLRKIWRDNTEEERLLGVSMTGILDNAILNNPDDEELPARLESIKEYCVEINKELAASIGIPQSVAITAIKPSGTTSQMVDSASGLHPRHAKHYFRRIRADNKDPLTQFMINSGIPNEPDVTKPGSTTVFTFPKKAPEGALLRADLTAIQHLKLWLIYQRHYCEHKPSVTISVSEKDWPEVGAFVWKHFDEMSGVSFLPYDGGSYRQAPYEDCTEQQYNELLQKIPETIDWDSVVELDDNGEGAQSLACTASGCEIT